jgi:hypothetical protein
MPNLGRTNTCDCFFLVVANQYISGVFGMISKKMVLEKERKPQSLMPQNGEQNNEKSLKNKEYKGKLVVGWLELHYLSIFNDSMFQKQKEGQLIYLNIQPLGQVLVLV